MDNQAMENIALAWDGAGLTSYLDGNYLPLTFACDRFGGMLGISSETCEKVKKQVFNGGGDPGVPIPKILINFPESDAASFFNYTPGGLKFFVLVCALVTAFNTSECAQIVSDLMGNRLDPEFAQRPTPEQLCPLISAIEARCQHSGFAEHVVDSEIEVSRRFRHLYSEADSQCRLSATPDTSAVVAIIELLLALRSESNPDGKLLAFRIYAGRCAPWIAAFLHWWMNKDWKMYSPEDSSERNLLHSKTRTSIKLALPKDTTFPEHFKVRAVYSDTPGLKEWTFETGNAERYGGLVQIDTYFRLMLCTFKLDQGLANKAAVEAIPYALNEARKSLTMCSEGCVSRTRWGDVCATTNKMIGAKMEIRQQEYYAGTDVHDISTDRFEPFPERRDINRILRLVEGCEEKHMQDMRNLQGKRNLHGKRMSDPRGKRINHQPEANAFLTGPAHEGEREKWTRGCFETQFPPEIPPKLKRIFREQIAHVAATILALSLFKDSEKLLVRPDPFIWQNAAVKPSTVISAICRILEGDEGCCDVTEWHLVCRMLTGESVHIEGSDESLKPQTIISCDAGQAVWPAVALGGVLPKSDESYLRMHWHRGNIYDDTTHERIHRVIGADSRVVPTEVPRSTFEIPEDLILPHISASKHSRVETSYITKTRNGLAVLYLGLAMYRDHDGVAVREGWSDPGGILKTLASAELIKDCRHPFDTVMDVPVALPPARPDVYMCPPNDALPWYWDWAGRADGDDDDEDGTVGAMLEHACSEAGAGSPPGSVAVVPVAGNEAMRFVALAKPVGAHVAVRRNACVACCVWFCMRHGYTILVL
ncbi:hypothetical protein F4804DRAFT_352890 [Jackrogersella minutella]|nr:hypothetical protein F4804DRAFT_352890 [Jackrogersella minutella]